MKVDMFKLGSDGQFKYEVNQPAAREGVLDDLIIRHPELIAQALDLTPKQVWPLAGGPLTPQLFGIDALLLVQQEGDAPELIVIESKRARNDDQRSCKALGQLIGYAARLCSTSVSQFESELLRRLGDGPLFLEPDRFHESPFKSMDEVVKAASKALELRRLRLWAVSDSIHPRLRNAIQWLGSCANNAGVSFSAVDLRRTGDTLSTIIDDTAEWSGRPPELRDAVQIVSSLIKDGNVSFAAFAVSKANESVVVSSEGPLLPPSKRTGPSASSVTPSLSVDEIRRVAEKYPERVLGEFLRKLIASPIASRLVFRNGTGENAILIDVKNGGASAGLIRLRPQGLWLAAQDKHFGNKVRARWVELGATGGEKQPKLEVSTLRSMASDFKVVIAFIKYAVKELVD